MLAIERRSQILTKLQQERRVLVSDLSQEYKVTEETIRRDLEKLEKEGVAKKTYGGAILNDNFNSDLPYTVRKKSNVVNKQQIAEIIADMIEDGDHIIMDASSTALYVAKSIKNKKNITLITNSVEIIIELSDITGWRILSTGGSLREGSLSFVGYQAEDMIKKFHVDKAIISCKGVDIENGFTDSNEMDAQVKKAILKSARQKILAADSSKFDKISFTKIGDFSDIDLIVTDNPLEERWKKILSNNGVEVLYSKKEGNDY